MFLVEEYCFYSGRTYGQHIGGGGGLLMETAAKNILGVGPLTEVVPHPDSNACCVHILS